MHRNDYHAMLNAAEAWQPKGSEADQEKTLASIIFTTTGEAKCGIAVKVCCGDAYSTIEGTPATEELWTTLDRLQAEAIAERDKQHRLKDKLKPIARELADKVRAALESDEIDTLAEDLKEVLPDQAPPQARRAYTSGMPITFID